MADVLGRRVNRGGPTPQAEGHHLSDEETAKGSLEMFVVVVCPELGQFTNETVSLVRQVGHSQKKMQLCIKSDTLHKCSSLGRAFTVTVYSAGTSDDMDPGRRT